MKRDIDAIVTTRGLSAGYRGKPVWRHADFTIRRGEFVGLLGANGAGKTTLFRLLLGLAKPLQGQIELFGAAPKKGSARVGYVPQRRTIDSESKLEALEYVRLGVTPHARSLRPFQRNQAERQESLAALQLVDGAELAHRPLSELSGGEMQRVFLAQALAGKPELLLLDEPLASLDIRRETELIRLVADIVRRQRIAVLLIAHDINPLLPVVDRIIYIANGRVASGKAEEVVNSQTLSTLYDAPIEVLRDSKGRLAVLGVEEAIHHVE